MAHIEESWIGFKADIVYREYSQFDRPVDGFLSIDAVDGARLPIMRWGWPKEGGWAVDPGRRELRLMAQLENREPHGTLLGGEPLGEKYTLIPERFVVTLEPGKRYALRGKLVSYDPRDGIDIWLEESDTGKVVSNGATRHYFRVSLVEEEPQ